MRHSKRLVESGWPKRPNPWHQFSYTGSAHPPIRLVAIDMDGTLLPTLRTTVSSRNAQALRAAQDAGVTVACHRPARGLHGPAARWAGPAADTPLITSNGAVVRTMAGTLLDNCHMESRVARGLCSC